MGNICDNHLQVSGTKQQVTELVAKIHDEFVDDVYEENVFENGNGLSGTLWFTSSSCFPKKIFKQITDSLADTENLYIRVASDEQAMAYLEQSIFEGGKWGFELEQKEACQPTLTRHGEETYAFTTGAYIQPVSYIGRDGKRYFGWIVTGFEDDTYQDGQYLEVEASGQSLQELMPDTELPDEDMTEGEHKECRETDDKTIWYCTECGSKNIKLKQWVLPNDADSLAGNESLDCNDRWCQDCEGHTELGTCKESEYSVRLEEIQEQKRSATKEDTLQEPENTLPPKERIRQMMLDYGTAYLDLDEHLATSSGYIHGVGTEWVDYRDGTAEYCANLDDDVLEDLAIAVEMQIEANEKTFKRCQD